MGLVIGAVAAVVLGGAALGFFALRGGSAPGEASVSTGGPTGGVTGQGLVSASVPSVSGAGATGPVEPTATAALAAPAASASATASAKTIAPPSSGAPRVGATSAPKTFRPKEL